VAEPLLPLPSTEAEVEHIEIDLLLEGLYRRYGVDFRGYSKTFVARRVRGLLLTEQLPSVSALQERLLRDPDRVESFLRVFSVGVTRFYRDPSVYLELRTKIVPVLRTYPRVRIWHAGCATGEEVYSLAALLDEEGLLERTQIYATDLSRRALDWAAAGAYPLRALRESEPAYERSGGRSALGRHYAVQDGLAVFHERLRERTVFAHHDLASDRSFNEFNVIVCRNVLIYFARALQDRVHRLFYESLVRFGYLVLGSRETVAFTPHQRRYHELAEKIFRKVA
jgi:chemotaxis protein methyltransferase CheR